MELNANKIDVYMNDRFWTSDPIINSDRLAKVTPKLRQHPIVRGVRKPGRNSPCPCGSGKKFKKCCLNRTR